MHAGIRNEMDDLRARWPNLEMGSGSCARWPERVEFVIAEYCERLGNRDGRGVRSTTVAEVRKSLRHLKSAARRVSTVGTPEGRAAKKLLKSLYHIGDFEVISDRARAYAGLLQRLGKRRAKRAAVCAARSIGLGQVDALGKVRLERLVSVADLESVGRELDLCVTNESEGRDYRECLRRNEAEFWQLRGREPFALLAIVRDDGGKHGKIVEFQMVTECEERLPRSTLFRIARELDASGDEIAEFERAGAFWVLRRPRPPTATIIIGKAHYQVWRFADEVIIRGRVKDSHGRRIGWSRFVRETVKPWHSRTRGRPWEEPWTDDIFPWHSRRRRRSRRLRRNRVSGDDAQLRIAGTWTWSSRCQGRHALCDRQLQALVFSSPEMFNLLA